MQSSSGEVKSGRALVPIVIGAALLVLLLLGGLLIVRSESHVNTVALVSSAKPVTVVEANASTFRSSRTYVGTIEPWIEAKVGPQLVSAYVDTVLLRPGAVVKKGDVLATLDCRNASAASQAVAMNARALDARQQAIAHESTRIQGLLDGGFVSPNEAEQKSAQSAAEQAQVLAEKAKLIGSSLEVSDCVLRSPFDGEVATRTIDPGAFVRPGISIVSVVDRRLVRITADAPEIDFSIVAPSTKVTIRVAATNTNLTGTISRRAPSADPGTRTVHFELDMPNADQSIPVGTTGELRIEVGEPMPASELPLAAASIRGSKASIFVVEGNVAHARVFAVKGELGGRLYLDTTLVPGSKVVTEGRALLNDGDAVLASTAPPSPAAEAAAKVKP